MLREYLTETGTTNLLNLCCEFLNGLDGNHVDNLEVALKEAGVNESLAQFIIRAKSFNNDFDAYAIRTYLSEIELPLPSDSQTELKKLLTIDDVYVKAFVVDATNLLQNAFNEYKTAFGTFRDWTIAFVLPEVVKNTQKYTHYNPRTFSLLSLCYPNENYTIKIHHLGVEFDFVKNDSLNDLYNSVVKKYNSIHGEKTSGDNTEFSKAMTLLSDIAPVWSKLKASANLRKNNSSSSYPSAVAKDNIIKLFAGNYDVVPFSEPKANSIDYSVIINPAKFNSYDDNRKKQITNALLANKDAFYDIIANASKSIKDGLLTLRM